MEEFQAKMYIYVLLYIMSSFSEMLYLYNFKKFFILTCATRESIFLNRKTVKLNLKQISRKAKLTAKCRDISCIFAFHSRNVKNPCHFFYRIFLFMFFTPRLSVDYRRNKHLFTILVNCALTVSRTMGRIIAVSGYNMGYHRYLR